MCWHSENLGITVIQVCTVRPRPKRTRCLLCGRRRGCHQIARHASHIRQEIPLIEGVVGAQAGIHVVEASVGRAFRLLQGRPRVGRTKSATGGPDGRVRPSRAGHTRAEASRRVLPAETGRAVARPRRCCKPCPARLARLGTPRICWKRVRTGPADIARRIPAQARRGGPERAELAVHIRRVGAGLAAGIQVVLARSTDNTGTSWRAPAAYQKKRVSISIASV